MSFICSSSGWAATSVGGLSIIVPPDGSSVESSVISVELNVVAAGRAAGLWRAATVAADFFVRSAKPVSVTVARGQSGAVKTVSIKLAGGLLPEMTMTASDGTCPAGTVNLSGFGVTADPAPQVTLPAGSAGRGRVLLRIDAGPFTAANARSPARCTAVLSASTASANGVPTHHVTCLDVEVIDFNDF